MVFRAILVEGSGCELKVVEFRFQVFFRGWGQSTYTLNPKPETLNLEYMAVL